MESAHSQPTFGVILYNLDSVDEDIPWPLRPSDRVSMTTLPTTLRAPMSSSARGAWSRGYTCEMVGFTFPRLNSRTISTICSALKVGVMEEDFGKFTCLRQLAQGG